MTTRSQLQLLIGCAVLGAARLAAAQTDVSVGYSGLPTKAGQASGNGVQVSDTVIMHAGIGVEGGYDSNVFYSEEANRKASPIVRVLPYIEFTNATRTGAVPTGLYFDFDLSATYRQYLSSDEDPAARGNKLSSRAEFLPTATAMLEFSPGQTMGFTLNDSFTRSEEPPYLGQSGQAASASIIRYVNIGSVQLRWSPGGGRAQANVRYTNSLDIFEQKSGLDFANSMSHEGMLDLAWKWLPKTALFLKISQGYVTYANRDEPGNQTDLRHKNSSAPFRAALGIRGLVTQKTSVNISVGYANAFYKGNGPNLDGVLGHLSLNVDIQVRPTVLTGVGLSYRHDFQNSIIGNYYNVDSLGLGLQQQLGARFSAAFSVRYEYRQFQFTGSSRTDHSIQAGAVADYHPKNWMYTGVGYSLLINDAGTPSTLTGPQGADFVKHQIFARLGVTY